MRHAVESRQPRICVVGSCMIDLISREPHLPTLGETLVGHSFHLGCRRERGEPGHGGGEAGRSRVDGGPRRF